MNGEVNKREKGNIDIFLLGCCTLVLLSLSLSLDFELYLIFNTAILAIFLTKDYLVGIKHTYSARLSVAK